jgi:hypothetical protein
MHRKKAEYNKKRETVDQKQMFLQAKHQPE